MDEQFVIMFNDFPEEVCAPGTTEEQAEHRCLTIKQDYMRRRQHDGVGLYVRAYSVKVTQETDDGKV